MNTVKIVLIDDEINIREGLRRIINRAPAFQVVADFSDGREALTWLEGNRTDIVLSDIRMPEMDGIELCKIISRKWSQIKVILLTGHAEFNYAHAAIKAGVVDYILKPCAPAIILETLHRAAKTVAIPTEAIHTLQTDGENGDNARNFTLGIQTDNPWIRTALSYVATNYDKDLSVRDIADHVHLSTSYFSTLFKEETGHNVSHFIHIVRIERSKVLLTNLQYKSYEVAGQVGYKTFRHFNEIFKLITGQTPSEYRRSIG
ncbi:response regulator [Paenibacillus sp. FSL R10-2734]|uniref:response regulator transcription factor n=1 Tax=Paenibacillus sp. FSL R10-2734 TaxID=2954691 RepID=UPI0030D9D511